jgi:Mor family transcriptional regulator
MERTSLYSNGIHSNRRFGKSGCDCQANLYSTEGGGGRAFYYFMPIGVSADVLISDAQIFDSLNGVILGWICLIFLPTWRHTK